MGRRKQAISVTVREAVLVTEAMHKSVMEKIDELLDIASKHYKKKFERPTEIRYDLRNKTAGQYVYRSRGKPSNFIRFNPILFYENKKVFVKGKGNESTVVHEMAHLIARQQFGTEIKPHKKEWKEVMKLFGVDDPKTTHSYNTDSIKVQKRERKPKVAPPEPVEIVENGEIHVVAMSPTQIIVNMEEMLASVKERKLKLSAMSEFVNEFYRVSEEFLSAYEIGERE